MSVATRRSIVIAGAFAGAAAVGIDALPWSSPSTPEFSREGLHVRFDAAIRPPRTPDEAAETTVRFRVEDVDGHPVTGLRPFAWISTREGESAPDEAACRRLVGSFTAGMLSARPAADLNAYLVLAMNHDNTISVINPQVAFSRTKLEHLVTLGGYPVDWTLGPRGRVFLTVPSANRVSVVDTQRFLVAANVVVGRKPVRVALHPDGRTLWVGNDGDGTVTVVDGERNVATATVQVGAGHHEFAFTGEGDVWVTSSGSAEAVAIDPRTREVVARVNVGDGAIDAAWSGAANAILLANGRTGELVVVDGTSRREVERVRLAPGIHAAHVDPTGRWVFVVNPATATVTILDASDTSRRHEIGGLVRPDTVVFTPRQAYIRDAGSARVQLLELASLERDAPPAKGDIRIGQAAPSASRDLGIIAPAAAAPDGGGVIFANPADKALFFYAEGMMAPMGTHANYTREPRGVLLLDRTLREVEPGIYGTTVPLRGRGPFDVAFVLESPRIVECLAWDPGDVGSEDETPHTAVRMTVEDEGTQLQSRRPATIRFRLSDPSGPIHAHEVRALVFREPGTWQARPAVRRTGAGFFAVEFVPPEPGRYRLLIGVDGRGAPLGTLAPLPLAIAPPAEAPTPVLQEDPS